MFKLKTFRNRYAAFILLPISAALFAGAPVSSAVAEGSPDKTANDGTTNRISAADPRFVYEGRFDFSDSNGPVVIWQASRVSLDFEGNTLALRFCRASASDAIIWRCLNGAKPMPARHVFAGLKSARMRKPGRRQ